MFNDFVHFQPCIHFYDLIHYEWERTVHWIWRTKNLCLFSCKILAFWKSLQQSTLNFSHFYNFYIMRCFILVSSRFIPIHIIGNILRLCNTRVCLSVFYPGFRNDILNSFFALLFIIYFLIILACFE